MVHGSRIILRSWERQLLVSTAARLDCAAVGKRTLPSVDTDRRFVTMDVSRDSSFETDQFELRIIINSTKLSDGKAYSLARSPHPKFDNGRQVYDAFMSPSETRLFMHECSGGDAVEFYYAVGDKKLYLSCYVDESGKASVCFIDREILLKEELKEATVNKKKGRPKTKKVVDIYAHQRNGFEFHFTMASCIRATARWMV